ncbi:hypothetical protein AAG906_038385 [Vitis piasezkii]
MQFHQYRALPPPRPARQFTYHSGWPQMRFPDTVVLLVYLQHVPPLRPFILFPEGYGPAHRDVQIVTQSGRVAHPPPVDRPFANFTPIAHYAGSHFHLDHPLTCFLVGLLIHKAGAIPSSLHQKVKFIHMGRIIMIQSDRDVVTSSEPVLQITHSEDDFHFTRLHSYGGGCTLHGATVQEQSLDHAPHMEGIVSILEAVEVQDLQRTLG